MLYCGPQELANLARVNLTYQTEATIRLYYHVEFEFSSRSQMVRCIKTIAESSRHAKIVRSLTLILDDDDDLAEKTLLETFARIMPVALEAMVNLVDFRARLPLDIHQSYVATGRFVE